MTSPPSRRRPQAPVPSHRLPSLGQGRRAGQGRPHRVRPEPFRPHRAAALCRRREALHHRAGGHQAGRRHRDRRPGRHQAGQHLPLRNIPTVPWCTRSSSARWVAPRSPAPPVPPSSSSPRMAPTPSCVCRPAKSATWTPAASATVGEVGNSDHANIQLGKAGRARWMGKRPITRGESHDPGRPPARRSVPAVASRRFPVGQGRSFVPVVRRRLRQDDCSSSSEW